MSQEQQGGRQSDREGGREGDRGAGARKLAEWVTMGLSLLLILAAAGYLVYLGLRPAPPLIPVEVVVLADQAEARDGGYILPLQVTNRGRRTLRKLELRLSQTAPGGSEQASHVTIEYLGEQAKAKVYAYVDHDPRAVSVTAEPTSYQLE